MQDTNFRGTASMMAASCDEAVHFDTHTHIQNALPHLRCHQTIFTDTTFIQDICSRLYCVNSYHNLHATPVQSLSLRTFQPFERPSVDMLHAIRQVRGCSGDSRPSFLAQFG